MDAVRLQYKYNNTAHRCLRQTGSEQK